DSTTSAKRIVICLRSRAACGGAIAEPHASQNRASARRLFPHTAQCGSVRLSTLFMRRPVRRWPAQTRLPFGLFVASRLRRTPSSGFPAIAKSPLVSLAQMSVALRAGIPPFYVMDVWLAAAERQRSHGDLVNLSAGQPSVGAPTAVRAAAKDALDNTVLGYTVALGIPELRSAIAGSYKERHGLVVDPDEVVITTGSSGGFLLAFLACFDVGDRVAIASPGYPCYRNILSALGCEVVEMPCRPESAGAGRDRGKPRQPHWDGDSTRGAGGDRVMV